MEDLIKLQKTVKEISSNLDATKNITVNLLKQIDSILAVNDQDIIPSRHFRSILDVIRTKKVWTSDEIIILFREVSSVIVSEQRLQRRKY